jgi:benzoate membrane transport protein
VTIEHNADRAAQTAPGAQPLRGSILQPALAGALAAFVGYASTFTLILTGLQAVGATPAQAGSGLLAVVGGIAILNVIIAWRTRLPVFIAWSTPGAAFLLTAGVPEGGFAAVVGAFLMTAALIVFAGVFKPFARVVAMIPQPIANAMLAGILLTLCIAPIKAIEALPLQALPILLSWAIALRFARRYAVPVAVLVTAVILVVTTTSLPPGAFVASWPAVEFVMPVFTLDALFRISLPLFVVTMASQNLPGIAVLKANGYEINPSPYFVATGAMSAALAPIGGLPVNLAAITAAICASPEAHPDPRMRWIASFTGGWTNVALVFLSGLAAAFVAASPPLLIQAVAGLALLSSLAAAAGNALSAEDTRLPAILAFVTTASGVTVLGIGAAFWGLVAGIALQLVLRMHPKART